MLCVAPVQAKNLHGIPFDLVGNMDLEEPMDRASNVTETHPFGLRVIVKEEDVNDEEYGHVTACQDEEKQSFADVKESNEILQIQVEKEEEEEYQLDSKPFQI